MKRGRRELSPAGTIPGSGAICQVRWRVGEKALDMTSFSFPMNRNSSDLDLDLRFVSEIIFEVNDKSVAEMRKNTAFLFEL